MTEMQAVVGYHWSPASRRAGIEADGLRIGSPPVVNGVEDVHRNRWISLCPTPTHAWWLSAGALHIGGFGGPELNGAWDLYQVDVSGLAVTTTRGPYPEVRVAGDIDPDRIVWVARRQFDEA